MKRNEHSFTNNLISWYSTAKRTLPWRETKDPYNVWLSEVILQQTRVEQGLPYYQSFVEQYPTVHDLANASEIGVLKTWEGLGYYSRARNLHATAKYVSKELKGVFPYSYDGLLKLKGVGPYTAAAIASICFDQVVPVIDGNVFRFASRYFGIKKDISEPKNRKHFEEVLKQVISREFPGMFNQGMMEFGATVCKPANPGCGSCIFRESCYAYNKGTWGQLPIKTNKIKVKDVHINYFIFYSNQSVLMRKRTGSFWSGLFEFYGTEQENPINDSTIEKELTPFYSKLKLKRYPPVKHLLSHRKLLISFFHARIEDEMVHQVSEHLNLAVYSWEDVLTLPCPKVIVNHLREVNF